MATGFSLPKGWKGVSASLVFILPPHLGSASTPVPWLDWAGLGFKAVLLFCGVGNPPFPFSSSLISLPFLSFSPSLFLFPLHLFSFFPPVFFYVSFPFPFFAFFFLSFPFLPPSPLSTRFSILFSIPLSFPFPCFLFLPLAFFLFISISSSMFSSFLSIPVSPLCFHIFFFLSFLLFFFFFLIPLSFFVSSPSLASLFFPLFLLIFLCLSLFPSSFHLSSLFPSPFPSFLHARPYTSRYPPLEDYSCSQPASARRQRAENGGAPAGARSPAREGAAPQKRRAAPTAQSSKPATPAGSGADHVQAPALRSHLAGSGALCSRGRCPPRPARAAAAPASLSPPSWSRRTRDGHQRRGAERPDG